MTRCMICFGNTGRVHYQKGKWTYRRCSGCSSLFLEQTPSYKEIEGQYRDFSYESGFINEPFIRARALQILDDAYRLCPEGKSVMDIGSGAGFLLDEAKKRKYVTLGIEPSRRLSDYARSNFGIHTICSMFTGTLAVRLSLKSDIIVLSHVIEHIPDPIPFMQAVWSCLRPGGLLVIETPNLDSWLHFVERERFTFLTPPDHVRLYSDRTLRTLMDQVCTSYDIVSTVSYTDLSHCRGMVQKLGKRIITLPNRQKSHGNQPSILKTIKAKILELLLNASTIGNRGSVIRWYIRKI